MRLSLKQILAALAKFSTKPECLARFLHAAIAGALPLNRAAATQAGAGASAGMALKIFVSKNELFRRGFAHYEIGGTRTGGVRRRSEVRVPPKDYLTPSRRSLRIAQPLLDMKFQSDFNSFIILVIEGARNA